MNITVLLLQPTNGVDTSISLDNVSRIRIVSDEKVINLFGPNSTFPEMVRLFSIKNNTMLEM